MNQCIGKSYEKFKIFFLKICIFPWTNPTLSLSSFFLGREFFIILRINDLFIFDIRCRVFFLFDQVMATVNNYPLFICFLRKDARLVFITIFQFDFMKVITFLRKRGPSLNIFFFFMAKLLK